MSVRDQIYAQPIAQIVEFQFDTEVVKVFADMISRSVPGYGTIVAMSGVLAGRYVQPASRCYDLGCSLGGTTLAMREQIADNDTQIIAIDNSPQMINRFSQMLDILDQGKSTVAKPNVELVQGDICDTEIVNASVVALNFTLQFIEKEKRLDLLQRIYDGLRPGGILILSEKLHFDDEHLNTLLIDLHHEFKKANGYSDMEISQKRTALENVLLPETLAVHKSRLEAVGFSSVDVWFQCFNFASMVAIKPKK